MNGHDPAAVDQATTRLRETQKREADIRSDGAKLIRKSNPASDGSDTNYVFLAFVIRFLPAGVVGLVMAAIFCASMSSTASGLNSLASTTIIDVYRRLIEPDRTEQHYVHMSKIFTVLWGLFSVGVAFFANRVGSLIEAVNVLGSLFYGTILGIFLLAFYFKQVAGTAAFVGALVGEAVVLYCWKFTEISYLWYNVIGCVVGIGAALVITALIPNGEDDVEPQVELSA
jgi:Na+/proline symporter